MTNIQCVICGGNDWKNVDEFRIKASGMCLCMKCGFVTYPEKISKTEDLKEFYRNEYRDPPSVSNVYSGQRKLHYHHEFLTPLFDRWKQEGFINPNILEVGAAFGMFLSWVKKEFPQSQISGTELTTTFRRNAYHEYGIILTEEIDTSKKYDLLVSYKVAEHIPFIDAELIKYKNLLTEKGLLYISVPCWFDTLSNFGLSGFDIEYYYHPNHINVWTRKLFETLLKKAGFEVIQQDHAMYDSTYLCKVNNDLQAVAPEYEDPNHILECLDKIKKASVAFQSHQFDEACSIWPKFPDAQTARYEVMRQKLHALGFSGIQEQFIKPMLEACPDNYTTMLFAGDISMRYDEWHTAIDYFQKAVKLKPRDPAALMALGNCFRHIANKSKDPKEKLHFFVEAREITKFLKTVSFQHSHEAMTWIFNDNARIPMPNE